MQLLCDAVPYVPVRVTGSALVAHRYTYVPPHCRTSQYSRTWIPLSVERSLWNDLAYTVFYGVRFAGFKSRANAFLLVEAARSLFVFYCFHYLFFLSIGRHCGAGVFGLIGCKSLSPSFALQTILNNNNMAIVSTIQNGLHG